VLGLAATLVLVAAVALGIVLLGDDTEPGAAGEARPGGVASAQSPSVSASTPTPTPSPSRSVIDGEEQPTPSPDRPTAPGPQTGRAQFVDDYFDTVPGEVDAAWQLLSPRMQQEVGRDSFDSFWGRMADVDATSVRAVNEVVEAEVVYTYESGRVVRQQNRYQLVRGAGGYLIDDETVISSRTVSE
jgi:hypothetical protein